MRQQNIINILKKAWKEGLILDVVYTNSYGTTNEYTIWDVKPDREFGNGRICEDGYIKAFCGTKDDDEYNDTYTFKIERFESIEGVEEMGYGEEDW